MDKNEKIDLLKTMTDETDDNVLTSYLLLAKNKLLNHLYPFDDTVTKVPRKYEYVEVELAAYLISRIGMEGEIARTENGVVHEFETGELPTELLKKVIPYAGNLS